jgi:hypothetical protein
VRKEIKEDLIIAGMLIIVSAIFTFIGFNYAGDKWEKEAVKNMCGYYDARSGDFTWTAEEYIKYEDEEDTE